MGCGGTILKNVDAGIDVFVCIATDGKSMGFDKAELKKRKNEARDASLFLGVKKTFFLGLPATRLDALPVFQVITKIKEVIRKVKPDAIYTHFYKDLMQDHVILSVATLIACKSFDFVKEVYMYEVPSSSSFNFGGLEFKPNVFVDISRYLSKKIKAMGIYKSEIKAYPHPRSSEGITICARFRGLTSHYKVAEAFIAYVQKK